MTKSQQMISQPIDQIKWYRKLHEVPINTIFFSYVQFNKIAFQSLLDLTKTESSKKVVSIYEFIYECHMITNATSERF